MLLVAGFFMFFVCALLAAFLWGGRGQFEKGRQLGLRQGLHQGLQDGLALGSSDRDRRVSEELARLRLIK